MADDIDDKQNKRLDEQVPEAPSPTTLLPMLISGLALIVIGMVVVMIFA